MMSKGLNAILIYLKSLSCKLRGERIKAYMNCCSYLFMRQTDSCSLEIGSSHFGFLIQRYILTAVSSKYSHTSLCTIERRMTIYVNFFTCKRIKFKNYHCQCCTLRRSNSLDLRYSVKHEMRQNDCLADAAA